MSEPSESEEPITVRVRALVEVEVKVRIWSTDVTLEDAAEEARAMVAVQLPRAKPDAGTLTVTKVHEPRSIEVTAQREPEAK